MKFMSHSLRRLALLAPCALVTLAGCGSAPLRHSTTEFVSPPTWVHDGHTVVKPVASATNLSPVYPLALRRYGVEGLVNVNCLIDATGRVQVATIASSTNSDFNNSTLRTLRNWTFQPATSDGVPIAMWVTLPIGYSIDR